LRFVPIEEWKYSLIFFPILLYQIRRFFFAAILPGKRSPAAFHILIKSLKAQIEYV